MNSGFLVDIDYHRSDIDGEILTLSEDLMTFQQLAIGSYFRLPGISYGYVYRKASSSSCSLNALLQPIRPTTKVIPLTAKEIAKYLAEKQKFLNNLKV